MQDYFVFEDKPWQASLIKLLHTLVELDILSPSHARDIFITTSDNRLSGFLSSETKYIWDKTWKGTFKEVKKNLDE